MLERTIYYICGTYIHFIKKQVCYKVIHYFITIYTVCYARYCTHTYICMYVCMCVYMCIEQFSNLELKILDVFITYIFRLKIIITTTCFWVGGTPRSSMKYLTGLLQSLAVPISTVYIDTARLCNNPVKYFTDKKCTSLDLISQNPDCIELQVWELLYICTVMLLYSCT
jgi:hypothetical protein